MDQDELELRLAEQTAILLDAEPRGLESKVVRRVRTAEGAARFGVPIGTIITRDIIERANRGRSGGRADTPAPRPSGGKPRDPDLDAFVARPVQDVKPGQAIALRGGEQPRVVRDVSVDDATGNTTVTFADGTAKRIGTSTTVRVFDPAATDDDAELGGRSARLDRERRPKKPAKPGKDKGTPEQRAEAARRVQLMRGKPATEAEIDKAVGQVIREGGGKPSGGAPAVGETRKPSDLKPGDRVRAVDGSRSSDFRVVSVRQRPNGRYDLNVETDDGFKQTMDLSPDSELTVAATPSGGGAPKRRESSTPIRTVEVSEVQPGMRVSYGGPDHAFEVAGVVGQDDEGQWEFTDDKGRPARFPDGAKLDVYAEPIEGPEADRPGDDDPEGQAAFDRGLEQGAAARERGATGTDDDEPSPPSGGPADETEAAVQRAAQLYAEAAAVRAADPAAARKLGDRGTAEFDALDLSRDERHRLVTRAVREGNEIAAGMPGAEATGAGGSRLPADDAELDALEVLRGRYDEPRPTPDETAAAEDALRERGWSDREIEVASSRRPFTEARRRVTPPPETIAYDPGNDMWVLGEQERPRAPRTEFESEKEARSFAQFWGFDVQDRDATSNPPTDGGDGGVPASSASERPTPTPEMEARGDGLTPLPEGRYPAGDPRNDPAYEAYVERVDATLTRALDQGLDTESQHSAVLPDGSRVWRRERQDVHYAIIDQIMADADERGVPKDGLAVMMGGLPGAGKSTFLKNHGDKLGLEIDAKGNPVNAIVINPDLIKDALMTGTYPDGRPLVETVDGLQRGEMAGLIHEESSVIAKMLAERVLAGNYNIVFDITLGDGEKARTKYLQKDDGTGALDRGYRVRTAFVDGDLATSLHRAGLRHKQPDPDNNGKRRMEGRYVPYSHITREAQADGLLAADGRPAKSRNRVEYDRLVATGIFEQAIRYDNVTDEFFTDAEGPDGGGGGGEDEGRAALVQFLAEGEDGRLPDADDLANMELSDEARAYLEQRVANPTEADEALAQFLAEGAADGNTDLPTPEEIDEMELSEEARDELNDMIAAYDDVAMGGGDGTGDGLADLYADDRFTALASRLEDVYAGADSDADDDADRRALELAEEYGLTVDEVRDAALEEAGFGPDDDAAAGDGPLPGADGFPAVAEERAALIEFGRENPNAEIELTREDQEPGDELVSIIPGVDELEDAILDAYGPAGSIGSDDEDDVTDATHPDLIQLLEDLDLTVDLEDDDAMDLLIARLEAAGYRGE